MRYYADYGNKKAKRVGGDAPNALVIFPENGWWVSGGDSMVDARAALLETPDSPVCGTSVSSDYLRESCKRISRAEAFRIHPSLERDMA